MVTHGPFAKCGRKSNFRCRLLVNKIYLINLIHWPQSLAMLPQLPFFVSSDRNSSLDDVRPPGFQELYTSERTIVPRAVIFKTFNTPLFKTNENLFENALTEQQSSLIDLIGQI